MKTTGTFLGWFEFRPVEEHSTAVVELGYRLNQAAWGHGYATEGSRALIHKGFTDMEVERVTANTMDVNTRSRRVMEKSGLSFVRNFTGDWPEAIEGSEHGEVEYELTRTEWEQARWTSTAKSTTLDNYSIEAPAVQGDLASHLVRLELRCVRDGPGRAAPACGLTWSPGL
ncbi:hypothetical protein F4556_005883 [Kitasatospora gansuensis]|uniref:N-acetyltransferase domain-containing protein n=1 Tax=Kitasatospora gansuensis TaxID=258050 RepID=A0A7W7SI73_9ACTN|nr:hypothetical protein [Kitasatospora gansuensis]